MGFRRTGSSIDDTARSLINGLIREGSGQTLRRFGQKIAADEGAEAIDPDFELLDVLYAAGLRSLGPYGADRMLSGTALFLKSSSSVSGGRGRPTAGSC